MMILIGILNKSVRLAIWKSKMAAIFKMATKIDLLKVISPWNRLYLVDFDDLSFISHGLTCVEFILYLFQIQNGGPFQEDGPKSTERKYFFSWNCMYLGDRDYFNFYSHAFKVAEFNL